MNVYYNEHDRFAAAWLRGLISDGLIPAGHVDERDIQLVQPADLAGYEQCHFFAGIGGWAYALDLAGWSGPVWTGSCPCQPFSQAGKGAGFSDARHLWPSWFRLLQECRPPVVFGEQVASAAGLAWLDHVSVDLESEAYAVGAADLAAASVGAHHIRQRLYWVADAGRAEHERQRGRGDASRAAGSAEGEAQEWERRGADARRGGADGRGLAHLDGGGRGQRPEPWGDEDKPGESASRRVDAGRRGGPRGVGHSVGERRSQGPYYEDGGGRVRPSRRSGASSGGLGHGLGAGLEIGGSERGMGHRQVGAHKGQAALGRSTPDWSDVVFWPCRDGKLRPVPTLAALFPLAHGISNRVGALRGAGNAIVPEVAAEFVRAYLEAKVR